MPIDTYAVLAIAVMAVVTLLLRLLPFLVFSQRKTPGYILYLGKVLPYAIMGMLVVYCLKDVAFTVYPFGIPAAVSVCLVAGLHLWRRNTLLSILCGTACYMLLSNLIV